MLEKSQASFLGLDKKEIKILSSIQQSPKSMYVISNEVNIPRATLYPIIEKLSDRGFIMNMKHGKRTLYKLTPTDQLVSRLSALIKELEWNIESPVPVQPNVISEKRHSEPVIASQQEIAPRSPQSTPTPSQKKSSNWFKKLFKR